MSHKIDLAIGYSVNEYLNNHVVRNTDEKLKILNSVAIIPAYCSTISSSYMHVGNNCYYCDIARNLLNILCGRKHQHIFEVINYSNFDFKNVLV